MASGHPIDGSAERFTMHLPRALSASGHARDQLRRWLQSLGTDDELLPDILLCASELVTNAVTHAGSGPTVRAALVDESRRLRLEVADASGQRPVKRPAGTAEGGFGMRVVDALASDWGWEPTPDGKVVWAVFELAA